MGAVLAVETLLRYLLTQILVQYANRCFHLERLGQKVIVYFAPNPPLRQKTLNELISEILNDTRHTRHSRRYTNYIRIPGLEYRKALLRVLRKDAKEITDLLNLTDVLEDLAHSMAGLAAV